ncbi:amino acid ABC transporter permease [Amycolatopsis nigrescens]|uniref:amino acid ABC transporter permease n=1 Tax=Amycolatopsis nigrescens TaxID=381445 RepID=UPI000369DB54|nr:amino acid ABC transporter permease [Amycolatopsis nigrescens]
MSKDAAELLFDVPGPRAKRRIRIATVLAILAGLGLAGLAVRQFAVNGQLDADKWAPYGTGVMWQYLLGGLRDTAIAAALSAVLAATIGLLLACGRLSRLAVLRVPAKIYVEVFRVIPTLLLVYVMLFALPRYGMDVPLLWKLVIPLTISRSAQFAEIFRAGILSLERGQGEAASALGLRPAQAMVHVLFPQAIRRVVPSLISQLVGIVKDTSLGFVVSYAELLFSGRVLATYNHLLIQTYLVVALIYFVINYSLSRFARWLEARQRANPKVSVTESDKPLVPALDLSAEAKAAAEDAAEWELAEKTAPAEPKKAAEPR